MKKFPWDCGDCPLLASWDMSCDDITYKCLWSKRQIDDCDRYRSDACPMEKHDKEVIRKFVEWAYDHSIIAGVRTKEARIAKYIEEYEKQMKEGGENG